MGELPAKDMRLPGLSFEVSRTRWFQDEMNSRRRSDDTISRLEELIQPLVESQGADLVELQYGRPKRGRGILRLFVDRPGGITIEELGPHQPDGGGPVGSS